MEPIRIGPYTLRQATERDRETLTVWIAEDPDHRETTKPEFFITPGEGVDCFALEDERGYVVFYIKMTQAIRLDIQFGPEEGEWNRDAMKQGFDWLRNGAASSGIHEIIFRSTNAPLVNFARRRLGFASASDELSHKVAPVSPYKAVRKPLHP